MRRRRNIFQNQSDRMAGIRNLSPVQIVTRVLGILSVIGAVLIMVNLNKIMAAMAVFVAKICSGGIVVFVALAIIIYLLLRLRWRIRSRFWRW
ncbi:hypothetical protein [uncultured Eubacterium sp.]|uniref:hypothetical protein n=1 Tax=uncultured Eubacterium sp. TaxID=165185 RepID=UPI0025E81FD5|nr:hypothetical protein [uncultured Eubacterium sp.]